MSLSMPKQEHKTHHPVVSSNIVRTMFGNVDIYVDILQCNNVTM